MSCRQPARTAMLAAANSSHATRICAGRLIRHLRDFFRLITLQQFARVRRAEPRVLGFNAQEKPVTAGAHKIRRIKHWVLWLRKSVQCQHAKHSGQTSAKHRTFKGNRDESRPGMEWLSAYVDGIGDRGNPILQSVS